VFNRGILGRNGTRSSGEISLFASLGYGSNYLRVSFLRIMHIWAGVSSVDSASSAFQIVLLGNLSKLVSSVTAWAFHACHWVSYCEPRHFILRLCIFRTT